jgi:membrane protease YdiL (CAAX protease family)
MVGVWGALSAVFIGFALLEKPIVGGQSFAITAVCWILFLGIVLVFAAKDVLRRVAAVGGSSAGWLLGVVLFLSFLLYAIGTGTASILRVVAVAAFVFVPLAILANARPATVGTWEDFLLALVWTAVKFGPSHWIWPYPGGRMAYVFLIMLAVGVALAGFLLLRGADNVGYSIGWGQHWGWYILGALGVFACIAIPVGMHLHFISYAPRFSEWKRFLPLSIAILCFTAWPEELLFRGLLQNFLSRATKSDLAGWVIASVLFGMSHISNMHFPNWRYVLLATIAGGLYGWTWRKTESIFASALVHAGVDVLWHFLFATA